MAAVELSYDLFEKDVDPNSTPIILTHGLFWSRFMFKEVGENLSNAMKCRVYSLDLRNHGLSPAPKDVSAELMAEDVKKFLEDKGIENVNFVCHSISSTVAYLVHLDLPDKVNKIVMIDCPPFFTSKEMGIEKYVAPQVTAQHTMLRTMDPKMSLKQAREKLYAMANRVEEDKKNFILKAANDLTKENGQFKWKIDLDYLLQKYIDKCFTPKARGSSNHEILLLRCENSVRIWDDKFKNVLKYNPRAKLVTFENSTHTLMFDRPKKFIEIVTEFLSSPSDGLETRRLV